MPAATFGNASGCEIDESTTRCHITALSPLLKTFSTENDQTQSCVMHTRKPFVGLKISRNLWYFLRWYIISIPQEIILTRSNWTLFSSVCSTIIAEWSNFLLRDIIKSRFWTSIQIQQKIVFLQPNIANALTDVKYATLLSCAKNDDWWLLNPKKT